MWRQGPPSTFRLSHSLERRQYAWTPRASSRVAFREGSDQEFVALFQAAASGSLDVWILILLIGVGYRPSTPLLSHEAGCDSP
jgi:hypothetical protein